VHVAKSRDVRFPRPLLMHTVIALPPPPGGLQALCYLFLTTQGCLSDVAEACKHTYRACPCPESFLFLSLLSMPSMLWEEGDSCLESICVTMPYLPSQARTRCKPKDETTVLIWKRERAIDTAGASQQQKHEV
jgi:hypothetical protein